MERYTRHLPQRTRKLVIGIVGGVVLLVGVVMIPYPGPGWLVVFGGLAILSQEFVWARQALRYGRQRYDRWIVWIKRQNRVVQALTFVLTSVVVIATLWLINAYGLLNAWLHLGQDWLKSPLL